MMVCVIVNSLVFSHRLKILFLRFPSPDLTIFLRINYKNYLKFRARGCDYKKVKTSTLGGAEEFPTGFFLILIPRDQLCEVNQTLNQIIFESVDTKILKCDRQMKAIDQDYPVERLFVIL